MVQLLLLLIPLAFVIFVVYKGMNPTLSFILAAILVALLEDLPLLETIIGSGSGPMAEPSTLLTGVSSAVTMFLLKFLAANLFGQLILRTGAAKSISDTLTKVLVERGKSEFSRKLLTAYVFMLIAIIFGFGGLDAFVCIFTLMPIGIEMFEEHDMPRRLIPAVLFAGVTTAVCCPGTPLTNGNILASMFFGTTTTAAFIPGIVGVIVILICDCIYIYRALKKAEKDGEHYTPVPVVPGMGPGQESEEVEASKQEKQELPPFLLSVVPLLIVAVLNMVFGVDVVIALVAGAVVASLTLYKYIVGNKKNKIKAYMDIYGAGVTAGSATFIPMAFQQGLANVIQATAGFAFLSAAFTALAVNVSPYLSFALSASFTGFLAGNAVTGIQLSAGIFVPLLDQINISAAAMHRISCFAVSILDTIPINAAVISALMTCGLTHKEGYGPIFRTTVLYIFYGMLAVILVCLLFPGLAV